VATYRDTADRFAAALFDLDGVLTPTAVVHRRAWSKMFNEFLTQRGQAAYSDADYYAYVDGKPRYDGVRDFLASRNIVLPEGEPGDGAGTETVCGLGNRKNLTFTAVLETEGVAAYPGSVRLLDHLAAKGIAMAVVSSSANADAVLTAAGLRERFGVVVDGKLAETEQIPGKPAPDTYLRAAELLNVAAADAVVYEDAVSGVAAGRAGAFGLVVGVDRGAGADQLIGAGADIVVSDLAELVP
jgi:beta-phosphoglucomutase family hydrolase